MLEICSGTGSEFAEEPRVWLSRFCLSLNYARGPCGQCRAHYDPSVATTVTADSFTSWSLSEDENKRAAVEQLAMVVCATHRRIHMARELIRAGVDVRQPPEPDHLLHSLVFLATAAGNLAITKVLVNYGHADVNVGERQHGNSPLMIAIELGHNEIAAFLVASGADPKKQITTANCPSRGQGTEAILPWQNSCFKMG